MAGSVAAPTRIGVVGINARAERLILPGLAASSRAQITAVCSRDPQKAVGVAESLARAHGVSVRPFSGVAELLASEVVDAVYLNTPLETHASLARAAIEAGCAVICEKPLTPTAAESDALATAAARAGVRTAVNFTYRSVLGFRLTERLLRERGIGAPLHAQVSLLQGHNFMPGFARASALLDSGAHLFDTLTALLGAAGFGAVTHVSGWPLSPELPDHGWSFSARTGSGCAVGALFSRSALGWHNGLRWTLAGDGAAIDVETDGLSLRARTASPGDGGPQAGWREVEPPPDLAADDARFPAFHMDRLVGAVRGEESFPGFVEAVVANRIAEALARSAREERWIAV